MSERPDDFIVPPEAPPAAEPPEADARIGDGRVSDVMSRVLRSVGALLLVVAASSFMFREWGQEDDVTRYLMLLGQLGLLAGAGFFCGLRLDEKRGARTFLSLAVAVIPIHFAVLGGVLYSQLALDAPTSHLAAHAVWRAGDAATAVGLIVGAQLLIIPATFVAMMTLARRHAWGLTVAFLGVSSVLLLPLREPNAMAIVIAVMTAVILFLQTRVFAGTAALSTPQGRFVRAMLAAPLLLVVGRTFLYYEVTLPFLGAAIFALGLISFVHDVRADGERALFGYAVSQLLAVGAMCLGWLAISADLVVPRFSDPVGSLDVPFMLLPLSVLFFVAARFGARGTHGYARVAALLVMGTVCSNAFAFDRIETGLLCLASGIAVGAYGAQLRQKAVVALGVLTGAVGLVSVAVLTIRIEALTHWGSLTALGVALIFGAALLDRNRQRLVRRLSALRGRMQSWSY